MPRIRSIKPEFFTSETIASVPKSARLTFIGLWTHADDNGVAPDNVRLITAAVDPLEEDPREALRSTREDLRRLHEAGLVVRYRAGGKRFIYVTSWDEHQKISHPAKPRYPHPADDDCEVLTCADVMALEDGPASSGVTPEGRPSIREILPPEQGAGSREQGAGEQGAGEQGIPPTAGSAVAPPPGDDGLFDGPASAGAKKSTTAAKRKPANGKAPNPNVARVVGAYVEGAQSKRKPRPDERLRKACGQQATDLLGQGYGLDEVMAAARVMGEGGWIDLSLQMQKMNGSGSLATATAGSKAPVSDDDEKFKGDSVSLGGKPW